MATPPDRQDVRPLSSGTAVVASGRDGREPERALLADSGLSASGWPTMRADITTPANLVRNDVQDFVTVSASWALASARDSHRVFQEITLGKAHRGWARTR